MQTRFNFYCDPAHGWIKVPLQLLIELGIAEQISPHSYINGKNAFLEEDRDASIFINAMSERIHKILLREFHTSNSSKIRNYMSYNYYKK